MLHPFDIHPAAVHLLSCLQYENDSSADLAAFMQCVFDPHDKLDEIAVVFAYNYYALLSAGPARLPDIAPLYADNSVSVMSSI